MWLWPMFTNHYNQYLCCKILHRGTLLQPWPNAFGMQNYFSGNYVFPSPKSSKDHKKGLHRKLKSFCPRIQVKTKKKKKKKKKHLHRNLELNSAGICGIYSCLQALFCLINQRSNLDEGTLNLDGEANSRWGDASPRRATERGGRGYNDPRAHRLWGPMGFRKAAGFSGPSRGPIEMTLRNQQVRPEDFFFLEIT